MTFNEWVDRLKELTIGPGDISISPKLLASLVEHIEGTRTALKSIIKYDERIGYHWSSVINIARKADKSFDEELYY